MVKSGSINGFPFGYQKKAVHPTIRNAKSETPGRYGASIDQLKEGGLDITLDVIAQSITERDAIVAAFMQRGRGRLGPGTPDNEWYYSGVCGDRSSDFRLSEYNPSVVYPLSFRFDTDSPFMHSNAIRSCGRQILSSGQTWSSGDSIAFNSVNNSGFESWTSHTGYDVPDGWALTQTPGSGVNAEVLQSTVHKYGSKSANLKNTNNASVSGVTYQTQYFEAGVEYTFGAWCYIDAYSGGDIEIELYIGSQGVANVRCGLTSEFTLVTTTYTFDTAPLNAYICFYVRGDASSSTNHYVDNVFCVKSSDFTEVETYGDYIQTAGTVETVPDIQIDGPPLDTNITPLAQEREEDTTIYSHPINVQSKTDETVYSTGNTSDSESDNTPVTKTYPGQGTITTSVNISYPFNTIFHTFNISAVEGAVVVVTHFSYSVVSGAANCGCTTLLAASGSSLTSLMGNFGAQSETVSREMNYTYNHLSEACNVDWILQNVYTTTYQFTNVNLVYHYYFPNYDLLKTITITSEEGITKAITGISYQGKAGHNYYNALFHVTVSYGSGSEVTIDDWTTNYTNYTTRTRTGINVGYTVEAITVRFYGKITTWTGGNISIQNCVVNDNSNSWYAPLNTMTVDPVLGQANTLSSISFQARTTNANNPARFYATIQNSGLYGGDETPFEEWQTSSTDYVIKSYVFLPQVCAITSSITIRFYGEVVNLFDGLAYLKLCKLEWGTSEDYTLLTTLTIDGTATGARTVVEYGYQFSTSQSHNPAMVDVRVQYGTGVETSLSIFSIDTSTLYSKVFQNQSLVGNVNEPIYLKFYGKLENGLPATFQIRNCYANYTGGFVIPNGLLQNVNVYNTADPFTKLNLCTALPHGSSIRVNADDTGFFRHRDNYLTNSYLSIIDSSSSNTAWYGYLVVGSGGNVTYTFDTRFPIDGIPMLIIRVMSGNPQISIAINENGVAGTFYSINGNLTTVPTGVNNFNLINIANCILSEATNISIRITPATGQTCAINFFEFFSYLLTVDAERLSISPDDITTFGIEMTENALCYISMGYNDRKWGI